MFRMDCVKSKFKEKEILDSIVTDPPYGIRAVKFQI